MSAETSRDGSPSTEAEGSTRRRRRLPPLPTRLRLVLHIAGWILIGLGLLGLALPGLQGILMLAAGAALVSLASDRLHARLRRWLRSWPHGRRHFERFRARLHAILSRSR